MDTLPISPEQSPLTSLQPTDNRSAAVMIGQSQFTDIQLLEKFKKMKKEAFDQRHVYERQWLRNVWYYLNRQWIYFDTRRGQWQDKRTAKWVPRPVTNVVRDSIDTIRANFAAINYGSTARPIGNEPNNVLAASVADDYLPVLYSDHGMDQIMNEFDYWLLTTGNAWLHTCVDYDRKNGVTVINHETCIGCGQDFAENVIAESGQMCPNCKGVEFEPTIDPSTGLQVQDEQPKPKGITIPLSPFEIAFPLMYERYDLAPYTIRMRWREADYYKNHSDDNMRNLARKMTFAKNPTERTMQIFKSLPFQNDLGFAPAFMGLGGGSNTDAEGMTEYDVWIKPCEEFKDGAVLRFVGDSDPQVVHIDGEKLPGALPYHDAKGNPLFTFVHAEYDHVGGRAIGSGLVDPIIQKQDQLNRVDSLIEMIIMRTANPIWLEPKGAEVEKFTGEPGLVVKWNPLISGGNAKPERIPGENIPASIFQYRALLKEEIQEQTGASDILKGQKPAGVDAFATTNLLLERGLARHACAFKSRGHAHKMWAKFALEIEREFGEETRTNAVMAKTKGWAFEIYKKADLSGDMEVIIEEGTTTAKTGLAERAAVEHLNQLGLINRQDSAQVYEIYRKFGCTDLLPGLDGQVQECAMLLERFAGKMGEMAADPMQQAQMGQAAQLGASPIAFKPWYEPQIFKQEVTNWCVSDTGRQVLTNPAAEAFMGAFMAEIDMSLAMKQMQMQAAQGGMEQPGNAQPGKGSGGGAGRSMANSSQNSAGAGKSSSSSAGTSDLSKQAA
jgi:hypothetical protein